MRPYFDAGSIVLYHADAREVFADAPAGFVHCVVTDPPYGMAYHDGQNVSVRADSARQGIRVFRSVLPDLERCMASPAHAYVFCHRWSMPDFMDTLAPYLSMRNLLVWDKGTPGRGDLTNWWFQFELVLFASKGERKALTGGRGRSIIIEAAPRARWHPTQKPVPLLRLLIEKSTAPGECTVDPFAGAGSTLVAAALAGRPALGVEIEERYCEVSARRVEAALRGEPEPQPEPRP